MKCDLIDTIKNISVSQIYIFDISITRKQTNVYFINIIMNW